MQNHSTLKGFKNITCHFTRPSIVTIVTFIFKFLQVTITPFKQVIMHTFDRYETVTPSHNLIMFWNLLQLVWNNGA